MPKNMVETLATMAPPKAPDRWFVTDGATSVGPVSLELLSRGLDAGKVPLDGFVRHESWSTWRRMSDLGEADPVFDVRKTIRMGSAVPLTYSAMVERVDAAAADKRAKDQDQATAEALAPPKVPEIASSPVPTSAPRPSPSKPRAAAPGSSAPAPRVGASQAPPPPRVGPSQPPPPPPARTTSQAPPPKMHSQAPPVPKSTSQAPPPPPPVPIDADDSAWRAAVDLPEALLLLLADAVKQCSADVALLHDVRQDAAVVVCSHGPRMFESIGARTPLTDPAITAARLGHTVMAEPAPASAGRAIRARLSKAGSSAEGAFMVPLRPNGTLSAFIEVGRATPFRAKDVAVVEALVEGLVHEVESNGWGEEWISDEYVEPEG